MKNRNISEARMYYALSRVVSKSTRGRINKVKYVRPPTFNEIMTRQVTQDVTFRAAEEDYVILNSSGRWDAFLAVLGFSGSETERVTVGERQLTEMNFVQQDWYVEDALLNVELGELVVSQPELDPTPVVSMPKGGGERLDALENQYPIAVAASKQYKRRMENFAKLARFWHEAFKTESDRQEMMREVTERIQLQRDEYSDKYNSAHGASWAWSIIAAIATAVAFAYGTGAL